MSFSSKAVANFFIEKSKQEKLDICPMKLQKLVYYAHGWHAGFTGEPLINEQVECWNYGPVIPSLYKEFRSYGNQPIKNYATKTKIMCTGPTSADFEEVIVLPRISKIPDNENTLKIMQSVWDHYKKYSAVQLSNMSHEKGAPWEETFREYDGKKLPKGTDIPYNRIKKYFAELAK